MSIDPNNKFTKMQRDDYDRRAKYKYKNDDYKDRLVGMYDEHNSWKPYERMMEDFFIESNNLRHPMNTIDLTCLDFGCGPGRNIIKYSNKFKKIDGVDISCAIIEKGLDFLNENNYEKKADLYHCDGVSLNSILDTKYDIVHSTITLQHIPVHEIRLNYFYEFYRVLNENGWITLQMGYNDLPIEEWHKNQVLGKNLFPYYDNAYHVRETNGRADVYVSSYEQLEKDLNKVGFKNFDYFITESPHANTNPHPKQIYFRAQKPATLDQDTKKEKTC
jgi:ubiquinone/menaquinone biosynthesis C-methylase UbiE